MHIIQYVHKIHILKVDILIVEMWIFFSTHTCLFWLIKNHVKHSKFTKNHKKSPKMILNRQKFTKNMPFSIENVSLTQNGNKNDPKRHRK